MSRTPEMIVCCWVDDPDPCCTIEPGHVLGRCVACNRQVRIGVRSVEIILEYGAQPWCVQCVAALPPESVELHRRAP